MFKLNFLLILKIKWTYVLQETYGAPNIPQTKIELVLVLNTEIVIMKKIPLLILIGMKPNKMEEIAFWLPINNVTIIILNLVKINPISIILL